MVQLGDLIRIRRRLFTVVAFTASGQPVLADDEGDRMVYAGGGSPW